MRVELKRGKQNELILSLIKRKGVTCAELAKWLGVSRTTLRAWILEINLLPFDIFEKIDQNGDYNKFIVGYKKENWGQIKGGNNSSGTTKKILLPKFSENLAEFVGILLGDGHICKYQKNKKIRTYMVVIAGDSRYDKEYLRNHVYHLSKNLFDIEPKFYESKRSNGFYLLLHSVKLIDYLSNMGLKSGNKIKNQVTIPLWVWKKNSYIRKCIRGLFDTDGCVYELLPHWPGLFQISLTNRNEKLLKDTRKALMRLGYKVSSISRPKGKGVPKIYITRKKEINRFCEEIGFKNQKHINRLKNYYDGLCS